MIGEKMTSQAAGRVIAWTVALAPAVLFVLTWTEDFAPWQELTRALGLPVLAAELIVIVISFGEGIRLHLPRMALALMIAWAVLAWITAASALHPPIALLRTGAWTIHLLFGLALVNLRHHGMLDFGEHLRAQQVGFLIFFALFVSFVATTDQTPIHRVFELPAFGHVRWFGYYAAGIIGLAASGFLNGNRRALLIATAGFALAFWTGTRGVAFAIGGGFVACTLLFSAFRSVRAWVRILLCGLAGFAAALLLERAVPLGDQGPTSMARYGSTGRVELWLDTINYIRMRPLFGWGEAQTAYTSAGKIYVAQPHEIVLQIVHAWGIVGGLLCLAAAAWTAPAFLRASDKAAAPFQCAALTLAAYSTIDGTLYYTQSTALFALCYAVAVARGLEEKQRQNATPSG